MVPDLIYEVGLYNSSDRTDTLHKAFRLIAIAANPVLTAAAQELSDGDCCRSGISRWQTKLTASELPREAFGLTSTQPGAAGSPSGSRRLLDPFPFPE
jgi:hypothetical protein